MQQANEPKRYRCYEIYSQSTGVEVREALATEQCWVERMEKRVAGSKKSLTS